MVEENFMSEYTTPDAEKLQEAFSAWAYGSDGSDGHEVDRFLAVREEEIRNQIVRDITNMERIIFSAEDFDRHKDECVGRINGLRDAVRIIEAFGNKN